MAGKLLIFSAPSGSGKTTIVRHLLDQNPELAFSISATTRSPRGQEQEGVDYYYLSVADFERRKEAGDFAEWEEVYPGRYYGTLRAEIERLWAEGKNIVFDIDVKGGINLKAAYPEQTLAVFLRVSSREVLEERLRKRGTESEEELQIRLDSILFEWQLAYKFDCELINDGTKEETCDQAQALYEKLKAGLLP